MATNDALILSVGVDATQAVAGANQAGVAFDGLQNRARRLAQVGPVVNEKLITVSNSLLMLSGAAGGSSRAMMLVSQGANLVGQAVAGMLSPIGLAVTALGLVVAATMGWAKANDDLVPALSDSAKATDAHVSALRALIESQDEYAGAAAKALQQLEAERVAQIAAAEAEILRLQTHSAEASWLERLKALTVGYLTQGAAGLTMTDAIILAEKRRADTLNELVIKLAELKQAQAEVSKIFEIPKPAEDIVLPGVDASKLTNYEPKVVPFSYERLMGEAIDEAREAWHDRLYKPMEEESKAVGQNIANTLAGQLTQAFQTGELAFDNMLASMAAKLAESAIFSMLMSIFNPGKGFMSFFGGILGFQHGTHFVPSTGLALLHRGEAVVPAGQNIYNQSMTRQINQGANQSVTINVYPQATDVRGIAKEIDSLIRRRQMVWATGA